MYGSISGAVRRAAHASSLGLAARISRSSPVLSSARFLATSNHYTTILMPSLSPTMEVGTIAAWKKKPGDSLQAGDVLCEIETDKASVGFEMQDDGVLAQILRKEQSGELKVGTPIALLVDDLDAFKSFKEVDPASFSGEQAAAPATTAAPASPQPTQTASTPAQSHTASPGNRSLSPAAAHMVRSQNIDVSSVSATGRHGKIVTKEDVINAIKTGSVKSSQKQTTASAPAQPQAQAQQPKAQAAVSSPAATASASGPTSSSSSNERFTDVPNSSMRKTIAKRLTQSKISVPHFYTTIDCEIDALLAFRKQLQKEMDVNVSVNDMVIKSAALALRDVPEANARWNPSSGHADVSPGVDVSVAVATPNGLITPIVTGADRRGLVGINTIVKDLATRARDGKLKPEEYQGGSFTISNLGMFGIDEFTAVINPPQACILAVGRGAARVLPPVDLGAAGGKPRVGTVVTATLSGDRRVVDNALAAQFLQAFRHYLSNPKALVL